MKKFLFLTISLAAMTLQAWADGFIYYHFQGKMGGKVSVELVFQKFEDGDEDIVAGYIYYPKAKNPAPILIVGSELQDNYYHFKEYQPDGVITCWLNIQIANEDAADGPTIADGDWTNPKTGATFSLTTLRSPDDMDRTPMYLPDWYENPLQYESPDHIGLEYGYQQWNDNYKEMMGGNVTFRAAGKNKVHFHVSNCPQNIAEGGSEPGRPAILEDGGFTYENVNECGYGFKASIFKKFLVLESTTEYETFRCFGMGVAFDAVYIKY